MTSSREGITKCTTHIAWSVLLVQGNRLSCKTGLGSIKDEFAPEMCVTNRFQYQIGRIASTMYVP